MRHLLFCLGVAFVLISSARADLPRKGWLGIQIQPRTAEEVKQSKPGVLIADVFPGSTAASGLKQGDLLVWLDGTIETQQQIGPVFAKAKPGDKLEARVIRGGKEEKVTLTVAEKPRDKGENYDVLYDDVESHGARLRILVSKPKTPGKHPVVFLIQGIGYSSMDTPLSGQGPYSQILKRFSDKGFVTVRVDKPGLGDSEGGPANAVDYERDQDSFRQGMKAVFTKYDFVDKDNVFIFGHSMGGCEGPVIATEFPVRGIAVYGTVARTWEEYSIQNTRRQGLLAGNPPEGLDQSIRKFIGAQNLLMTSGLSPQEIKDKFPQYAEGIDMFMPDGKTMSGIPLAFWKQCYGYNFADYWSKVNCPVLALWGESEFIASQEDHPFIADLVNAKHPGMATYKMVPQSDHGFRKTTSMKDSFDTWTKGGREFNPAVIDILDQWVAANLKK